MQLRKLFHRKEKKIPEERVNECGPGNQQQRQIDVDNIETDKIRLADISYDKKWICLISQHEDHVGNVTTTLSIRKFKAINDEILEDEHPAPVVDVNTSFTHESIVQMEANLQPQVRSTCMDQYISTSNDSYMFLSISPHGQYIVFSTYNSKSNDLDGSCIIFKVGENDIYFRDKIESNGFAIFLNREDELCLAIINISTLRIYQNIEVLSYDLYDLTSFGTTAEDSKALDGGARVTTNFSMMWCDNHCTISYKMRHILFLSSLIKSNVLVTPFTEKSSMIRLWSLNDGGTRIASIFAPEDVVIAISEDFKYAATVNRIRKIDDAKIVKVYNLENGCLAYKIAYDFEIDRLTHASFCYGSHYLALSGLFCVGVNEIGRRPRLIVNAFFAVLYIEGEKTIYSEVKAVEYSIKTFSSLSNSMGPFISEEMTGADGRFLKGYYNVIDQQNRFVIKCFELKIDDQKSNNFQWLSGFPHSSFSNYKDASLNNENSPDSVGRMIENQASEVLVNDESSSYAEVTDSLEEFINDILDTRLKENYVPLLKDIGVGSEYQNSLKYGLIEVGANSFLLCCGTRLLQVWQLTENNLKFGIQNLGNLRLVYIKAYTNSDYRSFYLSPNIWRTEAFKSIKFIGGSSEARVIMNIVEDEDVLPEQMRSNLTARTEEFFLPTAGDTEGFSYHTFEGACQALYLLNILLLSSSTEDDSWKKSKRNLQLLLFKKTYILIETEVQKIDRHCTSFNTTAGSKTLAMLASFKHGNNILKLLLKNKNLVFNLTTYTVDAGYAAGGINLSENTRYDISRFQAGSPEELIIPDGRIKYRRLLDREMKQPATLMNENVLTVLIRERQYDLYHLMLNRILSDSKNSGPECLLVFNDALHVLQELGNTDHYKKSCEKLSYLSIAKNTLLRSEVVARVPYGADLGIEGDLIMGIKDIYCFSGLERIRRLQHKKIDQMSNYHGMKKLLDITLDGWVKAESISHSALNFFKSPRTKASSELVTCVVPVSHLNTYYRNTVREAFCYRQGNTCISSTSLQSPYKKESNFLISALNQHNEPNIWRQGGDVMAIILHYKWKTFIRRRFYGVCIICFIYYISFCTGVQFALETYNYDSSSADSSITTNSQHLASIILFFLSGAILFYFEISQMRKSQEIIQYFKNWYNLVDLVAIILPLLNFLQLVLNWDNFYEFTSVCALILWLHGLIRLRVFSSVGIALETIIQLFQKVISVLCILLAVIAGFTHSFIALLRQKPDQYFQENYGGETSLSSNGEPAVAGETTLYDLSSSNGFSDPFKALYHVWLFIFGVWDPVTTGDSGDNRMVFILCMVFAFITVLIFTNMIIALMSSTVEEVKKRGKKVWITHFAAVIAEIEDLTFESTKHDRVNNPAFIFYLANSEKVSTHEEILQQETQKLRKALNIDDDSQ